MLAYTCSCVEELFEMPLTFPVGTWSQHGQFLVLYELGHSSIWELIFLSIGFKAISCVCNSSYYLPFFMMWCSEEFSDSWHEGFLSFTFSEVPGISWACPHMCVTTGASASPCFLVLNLGNSAFAYSLDDAVALLICFELSKLFKGS